MDFIETLGIENFQCIPSLELKLTPLHALIGPNDSGKSTILKAIRIMMALASGNLRVENGVGYPVHPEHFSPPYTLRMQLAGSEVGYRCRLGLKHISFGVENLVVEREFLSAQAQLINTLPASGWHWDNHDLTLDEQAGRAWPEGASLQDSPAKKEAERSYAFLRGGARFVHPSPEAMRQPARLQSIASAQEFSDERGSGLASVLDAVMSQDFENYEAINRKVKRLFPDVKSLSLPLVGDGVKELRVKLKDGREVPARNLSEGFLYYVLYTALPLLSPCSILLIEEPENGLHPSRIAEVMGILREISKITQVLIATHSPLVINELQPDEVTLITRPEGQGTRATPMRQTRNFDERSRIYALGELWLSYADGKQEAELMAPDEGTKDEGTKAEEPTP